MERDFKILREFILKTIKEESRINGLPYKNASIQALFKRAYEEHPDRERDIDTIKDVWKKHDELWWITKKTNDDRILTRSAIDLVKEAEKLLTIKFSSDMGTDPEPVPSNVTPSADEWERLNVSNKNRQEREAWYMKNLNPDKIIRKRIENAKRELKSNEPWSIKFSQILSNVHRAVERALSDVISDQSTFDADPRLFDKRM